MFALHGLLLFAVEESKKTEGPSLFNFLPFILIGILGIYFLMYLPARQEKKRRQQMADTLKKNDKIITHSGIIGVVSNINSGEEEITIRLEEGKMKILRQAIARIVTAETEKSGEKSATEEKK